jgi:hypothetical protein
MKHENTKPYVFGSREPVGEGLTSIAGRDTNNSRHDSKQGQASYHGIKGVCIDVPDKAIGEEISYYGGTPTPNFNNTSQLDFTSRIGSWHTNKISHMQKDVFSFQKNSFHIENPELEERHINSYRDCNQDSFSSNRFSDHSFHWKAREASEVTGCELAEEDLVSTKMRKSASLLSLGSPDMFRGGNLSKLGKPEVFGKNKARTITVLSEAEYIMPTKMFQKEVSSDGNHNKDSYLSKENIDSLIANARRHIHSSTDDPSLG